MNELTRLELLIGRWKTTGILFDGNQPIDGTDVYEWGNDRVFIRHEANVRMGNKDRRSIEIIGHDPQHDRFWSRSYDDEGGTAHAVLALDDRHFTIVSATTRFGGHFNADQSQLSGTWKRLSNGAWEKWMEIVLRRSGELEHPSP